MKEKRKRLIYKYQQLLLRMENNKGILSHSDKIIFMGFPYTAIKMMLRLSGNAPEVYSMFKNQLEQRETPKFKNE